MKDLWSNFTTEIGTVVESAASHFLENVNQHKITTVEQQQKKTSEGTRHKRNKNYIT